MRNIKLERGYTRVLQGGFTTGLGPKTELRRWNSEVSTEKAPEDTSCHHELILRMRDATPFGLTEFIGGQERAVMGCLSGGFFYSGSPHMHLSWSQVLKKVMGGFCPFSGVQQGIQ